MEQKIEFLKAKSFEIRKRMMEMCIKAGTGHCTSSLSATDILTTLYYGDVLRHDPANPDWEDRDRLFLSKGQASPLQYTILADLGYFDVECLEDFAQYGGAFGVHLQKSVPGVEITCGSLGHGFGLAAGSALAAKKDCKLNMVFSLLGDGECYEGSIWETAMFASHNRLNNLVVVVDRNFQCVTDFTENIVALEPMVDRWEAFGFNVKRIDGHDHAALLDAFYGARSRRSTKPLAIIADTVKGEGVDFMECVPLWHGIAPQDIDAEEALKKIHGRYVK
jgi:transketolase